MPDRYQPMFATDFPGFQDQDPNPDWVYTEENDMEHPCPQCGLYECEDGCDLCRRCITERDIHQDEHAEDA
jgi:hypothetical protein